VSADFEKLAAGEIREGDQVRFTGPDGEEWFRVTERVEKPKTVWLTLSPISPYLFGSLQIRPRKGTVLGVRRG
jgi:hypothetical protein